ncbi:hypothetical protein MMYC01_202973 [Madurella mycetomatis]|uniref:Uncharacterized protein n=1 Tax=Madurella mycetomatis TaxID=100816 RepID=A0A175WE43_9PEZI|nr:hypothetical protein MMYC01_202973 [Madurella mycetomatis]
MPAADIVYTASDTTPSRRQTVTEVLDDEITAIPSPVSRGTQLEDHTNGSQNRPSTLLSDLLVPPVSADACKTPSEATAFRVARFFKPKEIWENGVLGQAPFKLDTQPRQKSFALLLFANAETFDVCCKQCTSSKSKGPHFECFQPVVKYVYEAREDAKKKEKTQKYQLLTPGICRMATDRELEMWGKIIEDCLNKVVAEEDNLRQL